MSHAVIRASAGTGKTHALAVRFLTLLFAGVGPERILATTFTKKAAGEILERVLERLVEAARDPKELALLIEHLGPAGEGITAQRCESLVAELARQVDRFQVRTLDSFFAKVARLYAYELGLPPDWRVADEAELAEQSEESVGQVLLQQDSEAGKAGVLELLRELQGSNPANSVTSSLLRTVGAGLDVWCEAEPEAWDCVQLPPALEPAQLEDILNTFEQHPMPKGAKGKENGHWTKARAANVLDVQAGNWLRVLEKGLTGKVQADEDSFYKHTICDELRELLAPLLQHATHHVLAKVVSRNLAARTLLDRYHHELDRIQRDGGVLGFGDVPRAIVPGKEDEPLSERELDMWFRLDGRVDHLLLDEFQDTSSVQWRILARLSEEILGEAPGERSFFCVGDEKQSIYGFRQAEPRLLEQLHGLPMVEADELRESYRSAQVVLDVINQVFAPAASNPALLEVTGLDGEAVRRGVSAFAGSYAEHISARADLDGGVRLLEPEPEELPEGIEPLAPEERVLALAARRIAALAEQAPSATIGVLFRERKQIPRLLRMLEEAGVSASGEGGNPLTDSKAVVEALALLHLADYPGDTAAAFHVARCGLGERLDLPHGSSPEQREQLARSLRGRLIDEGFGGFLASLAGPMAARHPDPWQQGRFRQLVELGTAFDERGPVRPGDFVRHARRTRVESGTPAQVKVMTIHASKGLQFDAVVLPQLDKGMLGQNPAFLVHRPAPDGPIEALSHCPADAVRQLSPDLLRLWAAHVERSLRESLCLLYVAMTRASRRLELIVAEESESSGSGSAKKLSWAALLRGALVDQEDAHADRGDPDIPGARVLATADSAGPAAWAEGRTEARSEEQAQVPVLAAGLGLPPAPIGASPTSATQTQAQARGALARLAPRKDRARRRGLLVHRLLEEVEWLEDFDAPDAALEALLLPMDPDPELRSEALALFRGALGQEPIRTALSRSEHPGDVEVQRELRFCLRPASGPAAGRLVQGAMDRVLIQRKDGAAVAATVYDYKSEAGGEAEREAHALQLDAYRHVQSARLQLDPAAIRTLRIVLSDGSCEEL